MISPVDRLDDLRALYPMLDEGVAAIRRHMPGKDLIAADVYRLVANGDCRALVIHTEERVWGWATYGVVKKASGEIQGVAHDLYIHPDAPRFLLDEAVDYLEKQWAADGATTFHFQSGRKAWGRRLAPQGYRLTTYVFTKEAH